MYHGAPSDAHLIGNLVGFSMGLVLALLLLVLALRAIRLPGTSVANVLVAMAALAWNVGGLAHAGAVALWGVSEGSPALALAIQFTAAALWPLPILATWRPFAVQRWQRIGFRVLQLSALAVAMVTVTALWAAVILGVSLLPITVAKMTTALSALVLAGGAVMFLKGPQTSSTLRFSSLTILLGVCGATLSLVTRKVLPLSGSADAALGISTQQAPLLIVFGAFFLFARFRSADVFIRHSVRLLLAAAFSVAGVLLLHTTRVDALVMGAAYPLALRVFAGSLVFAVLVIAFAVIDRRVVEAVDRQIVRPPDYRRAARQLADALRGLHDEREIKAAAEDAVRQTLQLEAVDAVPWERLPGSLWPSDVQEAEIVELGEAHPLRDLLSMPAAELLVPVRASGRITHLLVVSPGANRRGLVTHEVNYVRVVATQLGGRLDALHREREVRDRTHRETVLRQQVTEAELRALRAQINPHFLFNSLNTIADLIVTNPAGAEAMTIRLAKVFRHVLTYSASTLTSVQEEVDFLRAYLQIEEARFAGRLHIDIDIPRSIASAHIPSLILQPVVENALKHGLAPRLGTGHLWIAGRADGQDLCLTVEDDGVGPGDDTWTPPRNMHLSSELAGEARSGVGLVNIARRLAVLYDERASLRLEPRHPNGTRVLIRLPIQSSATSVV